MALFNYQAYAKDGKRVQGSLDASSLQEVRDHLSRSNMYPISISEIKIGYSQRAWYTQLFRPKVSLRDKILFSKQLSIFLRSGIALLQALELLVDQFKKPLRSLLIDVKERVKQGQSLAQGLALYPEVFSSVYTQLIKAGEASGNLETMLNKLVDYLERQALLQRKIRSALTMPVIQIIIILIVIVLLLVFVIPKLTASFVGGTKTLPLATALVLALSSFFIAYWWVLLTLALALIVFYQVWRKTNSGAYIIDSTLLAMPLLGYFTRQNVIIQFCRTLGTLIESGVNLSDALDIVVQISDNTILKNVLSTARDRIIKQGKITEFLEQTNIFPPVALYLIKTGEESGQLGAMLLVVAKNYEEDLYEFSDTLSALLNPLITVVMALIVGFVIMAVMQPMLQQTESFS